MSNTTDPPIVVTGGSVIVEFKIDDFTQDTVPLPNGSRRHTHSNKKIRRIEVSGDNIQSYTADVPNGKVTVKIYYDNP